MWAMALYILAAASSAGVAHERAALADCTTLAPDARVRARYLFVPESIADKELNEFSQLLTYHVNSLSRRLAIVRFVAVNPRLWRLDIRDPGWKRETYEKLAGLDFYTHQKVALIEVDEVEEIGRFYLDGKAVQPKTPGALWVTEEYRKTGKRVKKPAADGRKASGQAPWLDPKTMYDLVALTQSEACYLRADWFWVQTARQLDREDNETGTGYYDWLELRSLDDVEKLAGLDVKLARKLERQIAAVVRKSGVAINNRAIFREGAASGGFWRTLDVAGGKDKRNALRLLNGDFVSEAQEIYAFLPNGLFFLAAVNTADRSLQPFVPERFARDKSTTNEDARIHPGFSCVRCHLEGLRPINDWARTFYTAPARLESPDYELQKHLEGLYFSPMQEWLEADTLIYSRALWRIAGWKPAELASAYSKWWKRLAEDDVPGDVLALELGVTRERMLAAFAAADRVQGRIDPVLGGYLRTPEIPASRNTLEEVYGIAAGYVRGFMP